MRGSRVNDLYRIIEWHQFPGGGWSWRLYRCANGQPLQFPTDAEARAALHTLRANLVPGCFRVHHGGLTMKSVVRQGHAIKPPKDMAAYVRALALAESA